MPIDSIEMLLDEVRLLFHRAAAVVEELHAEEAVTAGMRAVLERVDRAGPQTVPDIARSRHVTRQHIQELTNVLLERGLVAMQENPAHRRSALVALTDEGTRTIRRMRSREQRYLAALKPACNQDDLAQAAATLAAVRDSIGANLDRAT